MSTNDQTPRSRERAAILLLVGVALLMPPLVQIFEINVKIAGIPFTLVYLFGVWAILIAGTAWLTRTVSDRDRDSGDVG